MFDHGLDGGATRELIKQVSKGVATILGPASSEAGEWLGDYVRSTRGLWRLKNALATLDKVQVIFRHRAIEGKPIPIPLRQAMPILDAIAQEDEPSIQEMWATLDSQRQ